MKRCIKAAAACLAFFIIACMGVYQYRQELLAESLSEKILRFHVLANSDSEEDQKLKCQVRDAVGAYMQQELSGVSGLWESREIAEQDMDEIVEIAENVLQKQNCSYPVEARLARVEFPEKTYGSYTFPEGEYEALQVVIGQGKGQNWWCVMYPNMCFFNSVYEVVDEEADQALKETLSGEEYQALLQNNKIRIKWKWLDFLN